MSNIHKIRRLRSGWGDTIPSAKAYWSRKIERVAETLKGEAFDRSCALLDELDAFCEMATLTKSYDTGQVDSFGQAAFAEVVELQHAQFIANPKPRHMSLATILLANAEREKRKRRGRAK